MGKGYVLENCNHSSTRLSHVCYSYILTENRRLMRIMDYWMTFDFPYYISYLKVRENKLREHCVAINFELPCGKRHLKLYLRWIHLSICTYEIVTCILHCGKDTWDLRSNRENTARLIKVHENSSWCKSNLFGKLCKHIFECHAHLASL